LYQVYASIQGARIINVPLSPDRNFSVNTDALLHACNDLTKLIFLCSPNNPVGTVIPREQILEIVEARVAKSVVVIDEAYIEYSNIDSLAPLVSRYDNLVVLRTLSKGLALAGARCGAVIASAGLIRLLDGVLAPYALSSPVIAAAERVLSDWQLAQARESVSQVVAERERLRVELDNCSAVRQIWPSQGNFLFVRFKNPDRVRSALETAGIVIRTFANDPALREYARITIASAADNNRLIHAIGSLR
jgi:histidinol-phosphate aminotransferase